MSASVRRSSTEIGTAFEKHSQRYLNNHLHMSLRRVGGAGDGGVDLRGSWYVPYDTGVPGSSRQAVKSSAGGLRGAREEWRRLRVVGQCKAEKKALGPRAVRELEGVVAHLQGSRKGKERVHSFEYHPLLDDCSDFIANQITVYGIDGCDPEAQFDPEEVVDCDSDIIAILISQSGFSKNAMGHASKSHTPLLLVHLPGGQAISAAEDEAARLGQKEAVEVGGVWWNSALSGPAGILKGKMELRREILTDSGLDQVTGSAQIKTRHTLYHDGRKFGRLGPALGEMEDA